MVEVHRGFPAACVRAASLSTRRAQDRRCIHLDVPKGSYRRHVTLRRHNEAQGSLSFVLVNGRRPCATFPHGISGTWPGLCQFACRVVPPRQRTAAALPPSTPQAEPAPDSQIRSRFAHEAVPAQHHSIQCTSISLAVLKCWLDPATRAVASLSLAAVFVKQSGAGAKALAAVV